MGPGVGDFWVFVGNEASGVGPNVAVAIELPGSGEGEVMVVVIVAELVTSASTAGGRSVGLGSSVAGTSVADVLISPAGRADSAGPATAPDSVHATTTINAIANTPIVWLRTDGEQRFAPFFAGIHMIRPSHDDRTSTSGVNRRAILRNASVYSSAFRTAATTFSGVG